VADTGRKTDEDGYWALCSGELLPALLGAGNKQQQSWEKSRTGWGGNRRRQEKRGRSKKEEREKNERTLVGSIFVFKF
jgi:hypothetical protein